MRIDDRVLGAMILAQLIAAIVMAAVVVVLVVVLLATAHADTLQPFADDRSAVLMLHACDIHGCGDIIPPQDDASLPQCMATSQAVAAAWAAAHPEWSVRSIWCSGAAR